jgi:hypothetical protein
MSSLVNTLCGGFRPFGLAALLSKAVPMKPLPSSSCSVSNAGLGRTCRLRTGESLLFNSIGAATVAPARAALESAVRNRGALLALLDEPAPTCAPAKIPLVEAALA